MSTDAALQLQARKLVQATYVATQALRLYPLENDTVQHSLASLHRVAAGALRSEGPLELRLSGEFFFLNEVRVRTDLSTLETFGAVVRLLSRHGIGCVRIDPDVEEIEWAPFLSLLLKPGESDRPIAALVDELRRAGVSHIHLTEAKTVLPAGLEDAEEERERHARRTYMDAVRVIEEVHGDLRRTGSANVRKAKRAVQGLVDRVLSHEASMLAMTTLRDFDAYPLTHAVNTCLFSLVIGKKLGLSKTELFQLGFAGYFTDIGMVGLTPELLERDSVTEGEWEEIKRHPGIGLRYLFKMRGFSEAPYRAMLAAYEHHMGALLTGYPAVVRERQPTIFSRIIAVADGFDAALSKRSYRYLPKPPDRVLMEMRDDSQWGMDPLVTKVFVGVLGAYPVGTLVLLDTGELAIVTARSSNPAAVWRPVVKILTDRKGVGLPEPITADLTEKAGVTARPLRSVERALEAQRYGVNVGAYFL